jgi:hypothetical protein
MVVALAFSLGIKPHHFHSSAFPGMLCCTGSSFAGLSDMSSANSHHFHFHPSRGLKNIEMIGEIDGIFGEQLRLLLGQIYFILLCEFHIEECIVG